MLVHTKASVHSPDAATRDTASPSNAVTFLSDGVGWLAIGSPAASSTGSTGGHAHSPPLAVTTAVVFPPHAI